MGYGFFAHGAAKWSRGPAGFAKLLAQIGTPLPTPTAWVVTLVEVFGGLAILIGAFVALATLPLIVSMLVAMFTVQLRYGFSSVNTIGLTPSGPLLRSTRLRDQPALHRRAGGARARRTGSWSVRPLAVAPAGSVHGDRNGSACSGGTSSARRLTTGMTST